MRAVVQRVSRAKVAVAGEVIAEIGNGFLVLLGVGKDDSEQDAEWLSEKIATLRVFEDSEGKMNLDISQVDGSMLIVSQFTLYADCRKGRRPGFDQAAPPETAEQLYNYFIEKVKAKGIPVQTGKFQAMMDVELVNQGPVTLLLDSKKGF
jgi:D-tyrosyl-tRNA(Tyr) deacylase